ncbi:MAG: response regulator [Fibrobacterota bacterium]
MHSAPSVLIVEDEAIMVMLLEKRLEVRGFRICGTASTKEEAVRMALENSPEFIIMDVRLSGEGDGIEAAREICTSINTHVIFITGYSGGDVKKRAMEIHPDGYLVKPFEISELLMVMESVFG